MTTAGLINGGGIYITSNSNGLNSCECNNNNANNQNGNTGGSGGNGTGAVQVIVNYVGTDGNGVNLAIIGGGIYITSNR